MEIGPYIDYLIEKQGIKNIFGRFWGFFLCILDFSFVICVSQSGLEYMNETWLLIISIIISLCNPTF